MSAPARQPLSLAKRRLGAICEIQATNKDSLDAIRRNKSECLATIVAEAGLPADVALEYLQMLQRAYPAAPGVLR